MKTPLIQIIQFMLVPGVMVSACGLLLLGMNNKYSLIINRIRLLKDEERKLLHQKALDPEGVRAAKIASQIPRLMNRLRLVRDTVISFSIGIGLFILSSLFIGFQFISGARLIQVGIVVSFLAGMACVFVGVIYSAIEIYRGYDIIRIETHPMLGEEEQSGDGHPA